MRELLGQTAFCCGLTFHPIVFTGGCAFLSALLYASASSSLSAAATAKGKVARADVNFIQGTFKSGLIEIGISKAVLPNLGLPSVRDFAQKMISDHTLLNQELASLAANKGIILSPENPKLEPRWTVRTKTTDRDYMATMVKDHQDVVALYKKASKSEDPDIATFAGNTLPLIEHHLLMAIDLRKAVPE